MATVRRLLDVKTNWIDKAINYVDPVRGARRLHARFNLALAGGYIGARRDRRATSQWNPGGNSADADILPDLPELRDRSRDLVRNSPLAGGAISTVVSSVVGTGLSPQSRIDREFLNLSEDEAAAWQKLAEREFRFFAETKECDITRTQDFYEQQDLVFRSALESGDCFTLLPMIDRPGSIYSLRTQIIEADRVCNKNRMADGLGENANVYGGVVLDQYGAPTAYHIARRHPGSISAQALEWDVVPAFADNSRRNVLHHFDRIRPGQTRGVPYLAGVIEPLKQLERYTEAELMAAVVAGLFTVFVKSNGDGLGDMEPVEGRAAGKDGKPSDALGNGLILDLKPGESIETANPGRPNGQFDPFVMSILRQIGVRLELPFEVLIKHFTASYSAARAALLEAWRFFRRRRVWLASSFCQPVWEAFLWEAVARGRLNAPGFLDYPDIRAAYCRAEWNGDAPGQIDPQKEVGAAMERINGKLSTRSAETAALTGRDWETEFPQMVKEERMLQQAGLTSAAAQTGGVPPSTPPAPPQDPDKPDFEEQ